MLQSLRMTVATTFWVTLLATFLATVPAVILGIAIERSLARRGEQRRQVQRRAIVYQAGGPFYNARDWANAISNAARTGAPLPVSQSTTSAASLISLATSNLVPDTMRVEFNVLTAHVERLQDLTRGLIGRTLPSELAPAVVAEADYVAGVCKTLIGAAEKAATAR